MRVYIVKWLGWVFFMIAMSVLAKAGGFDCPRGKAEVGEKYHAYGECQPDESKPETSQAQKIRSLCSFKISKLEWSRERDSRQDATLKKEYVIGPAQFAESNETMVAKPITEEVSGGTIKQSISVGWDYAREGGGQGTQAYLAGDDDPMCQQLKEYMNRVAPNWIQEGVGLLFNYCAPMAQSAPVFLEPPWIELDPRKHEKLIAKLLRYRAEGADRYFSSESWELRRKDSYYEKEAKDFIDEGGRVQYWKTRLQETFDDPVERRIMPAPSGEQSIIQLRFVVDYSIDEHFRNQGCSLPTWRGSYFIVTDDLSGPKRIRGFANDSNLLIYNGDPVFLSEGVEEIVVYSKNNLHYCHLTYPNKFKEGK